MAREFHWLLFSARIQFKNFKVLIPVSKAQLGLAPSYMRELIHRSHSVASHRPLRSSDRLDLLVPHIKTSLVQSRYFASKGTALWNELPASAHSSILTDNISSEWLYR